MKIHFKGAKKRAFDPLATLRELAYPFLMKFIKPFVLLSLLALGGCSTFQGLKTDLASGYDAVTGTFQKPVDPVKEEKKKLPVYDGTCPVATVRPDLKHLVEFYDDAKPGEAGKISEVTIAGIANTCRVENDKLVMQIDLSLDGKTGPKARMKPGDKPSFAYPYFVAVTDTQGNVLSKEIFAASVSYAAEQKDVHQSETIFQNMPFPDASVGNVYNVIIGFQLTEQQLAYNQQQHPAEQAPVAATPLVMKPSPKASAAKGAAKPANN